jgi:hypothetical protein
MLTRQKAATRDPTLTGKVNSQARLAFLSLFFLQYNVVNHSHLCPTQTMAAAVMKISTLNISQNFWS